MQDSSAALENPGRIPAESSDNIKVLSQELPEEMEAEKSEGRIEKVAATCQKVNDRLEKFQQQLDEYKDTEVRGVWDVIPWNNRMKVAGVIS